MTTVLDKMARDLKLRGLAKNTTSEYLRYARRFAAYHKRPLEEMGETEILIDGDRVKKTLEPILSNEDLAKYIL